jgi:microcystin-dependent protein|uniref:hypothetical protein n=1 Tax=uncultured Allisonella sp. TaxID=339338 RepID=UPI0025991184|nr:hypothetical protein [uncultured Allisonella sp.]
MSEYTDGTVKYKVEKIGGGGLLSGVIMAFSGTFDTNGYPIDKNTGNADTTWHLCDGTNDTPDLRGRFILGASASHSVGTTGGEEETGLEIEHLPPHSFSGTTSTNGNHNHSMSLAQRHGGDGENTHGVAYFSNGDTSKYSGGNATGYTNTTGNHNHTFTTNTLGSGVKHNNMPPYYTLAFIMKL